MTIQTIIASLNRTRAELAQSEPEGPTDEELWQIWHDVDGSIPTIFRAVLARFGRLAIEPVLPEPGVADHITDDEGTRWDRITDAALWAKAFCLICPEMASREDVMIGWFANAIMAGWDHHGWKMDAERKPVPVGERPWEREGWCDAEGRCWMMNELEWAFRKQYKSLDSYYFYGYTHLLPHWALPVPTSQEGG
jgi:hypothetical protein